MISCHAIYPNDNNPNQGNQARFPKEMVGDHPQIYQEAYRKINEYDNGTPEHDNTGT